MIPSTYTKKICGIVVMNSQTKKQKAINFEKEDEYP